MDVLYTYFFFFCSGLIQTDICAVFNEGNYVTALLGSKGMTQGFGGELFRQPVCDSDPMQMQTEQFGTLSLRHCWLVIPADNSTNVNESQDKMQYTFPIVRFISYSSIWRQVIIDIALKNTWLDNT